MASANDKQTKKELDAKNREMRLAGVVPKVVNFNLDAGKRVDTAWTWIPRLKNVILISFSVSILCMLGCVYSVYSRPSAMLFLSLPDGTIACSPLLDQKGKPLKRGRDYQAMCDRLVPPPGFEMKAAGGK
jgi:hypothetical protein